MDKKEILNIIEYIDSIYSKQEFIPEDLRKIIQDNIYFNKYLVLYINKKLDFMLIKDSSAFFKELISILNLLSRGNIYQIFKDDDTYNFDEIQNLFRYYESSLQKLNSNETMFNTIFEAYLCLLKVYQNLCLIDLIETNKRESISKINSILTETINMLKFTTKLTNNQLNKLNDKLGQILYNFSHSPFINFENEELCYIVDTYYFSFEKIYDGYQLSKESNSLETNQNISYINLKRNVSYLLLDMLKNLETRFDMNAYLIRSPLKKHMVLYEKVFNISFEYNILTLEILRNSLLNFLTLTYTISNKNLEEIHTYKDVIDNFINTSSKYNICNLKPIHDILYFSKDLKNSEYKSIAFILTTEKPIQNDYYEKYKLKILDIILSYLSKVKIGPKDKELIDAIVKYKERK